MRTNASTSGLSAALLLTMCLTFAGCKPSGPSTTNVMQSTAPDGPVEKSEVELSDAQVTVTPEGILKFKVYYTFVKGKPALNYVCVLALPGTTNQGEKPLQNWELKQSGSIQGTIELQSLEPKTKEFVLTLGEAEVPQSGYQTISNKLTGEVVHLEPTP